MIAMICSFPKSLLPSRLQLESLTSHGSGYRVRMPPLAREGVTLKNRLRKALHAVRLSYPAIAVSVDTWGNNHGLAGAPPESRRALRND